MAVESPTTLGTRRAVTAPSRRQLGGSILAAACGAAFAGAVVLPDPGEAFPAEGIRISRTPPQPSPDARLLALCAEFFRVDTSVEAVPDDDALFPVMEARDTLAQRISATRAASAAGLQAKARVGHFLMNERQLPGEPLDDVDSYGMALLGELMAGNVEPVPLPVSRDAELIRLCAECDALQRRIDALYLPQLDHLPTSEILAAEGTRTRAVKPIADRQDPLLERICDLRATTPQGHAARARTLVGWDQAPIWEEDGCWNSQLIGAIVRDLVGAA